MHSKQRYWFPAKRYGWGWGLPATWEGWIVLSAYIALVMAGALLLSPAKDTVSFIIFIVGVSLLLLGICWFKGEPPRWRWGKE